MMTNISRSIVASIGLAFAVAACGGSGGMTPPAVAEATATPAGGLSGSALFTVKIPHAGVTASDAKRPAYLTPQVQGIDFSVYANDGSVPNSRGYVFYALSPQATYCVDSASVLTCTLAVQAYPGNDFFAITTYDQNNPTTPGGSGGSSHVISTGSAVATIAANTTNTISIVTSGVVSKLLIGLDNPLPAVGTPVTQPVHVAAFDADYNLIVGNFDQPVSLTDSDTSGVTSLSQTSIASSADVPTLSYTGGTLAQYAFLTVTTQSPSDTLNRGPFTANIGFFPDGGGLWPSPSYLAFASVSAGPQTVTIKGTGSVYQSVSGCTGTVSINSVPPNSTPPISTVVSVSPTPQTYTVTPLVKGSCNLQFSYSNGTSTTVPIVVSPN
jgi:hypothetical protein